MNSEQKERFFKCAIPVKFDLISLTERERERERHFHSLFPRQFYILLSFPWPIFVRKAMSSIGNDYRSLIRVKIMIKIMYGHLYWSPYRKVGSGGSTQKDIKAMELTSEEVVKFGRVWSGILPWAKCQWILTGRMSDNSRKILYYQLLTIIFALIIITYRRLEN